MVTRLCGRVCGGRCLPAAKDGKKVGTTLFSGPSLRLGSPALLKILAAAGMTLSTSHELTFAMEFDSIPRIL